MYHCHPTLHMTKPRVRGAKKLPHAGSRLWEWDLDTGRLTPEPTFCILLVTASLHDRNSDPDR